MRLILYDIIQVEIFCFSKYVSFCIGGKLKKYFFYILSIKDLEKTDIKEKSIRISFKNPEEPAPTFVEHINIKETLKTIQRKHVTLTRNY